MGGFVQKTKNQELVVKKRKGMREREERETLLKNKNNVLQ